MDWLRNNFISIIFQQHFYNHISHFFFLRTSVDWIVFALFSFLWYLQSVPFQIEYAYKRLFVSELTFSILFLLWYLSFVIGHVLYQENLLLILSRIYQHCFHLNVNILLHLYLVVTFFFRLFFGFWLVGLTISSFLISAHTSSIPSVSPFNLKKYTHKKKNWQHVYFIHEEFCDFRSWQNGKHEFICVQYQSHTNVQQNLIEIVVLYTISFCR